MNPEFIQAARRAGYAWDDEVFAEIFNKISNKVQKLKDRAEGDSQEYAYNLLDHLLAWISTGEDVPTNIVPSTTVFEGGLHDNHINR